MNKVIIMGRMTKDPELKYSQSGTAVAKFSIAVDTGWGDKKETSFFNVVAFKKSAENICKYFSKGQRILCEGSLKQNSWTDKDGNKRSTVEINLFQFDFIESKGSKSDSQPAQNQQSEEPPMFPTDNPFDDEGIPF